MERNQDGSRASSVSLVGIVLADGSVLGGIVEALIAGAAAGGIAWFGVRSNRKTAAADLEGQFKLATAQMDRQLQIATQQMDRQLQIATEQMSNELMLARRQTFVTAFSEAARYCAHVRQFADSAEKWAALQQPARRPHPGDSPGTTDAAAEATAIVELNGTELTRHKFDMMQIALGGVEDAISFLEYSRDWDERQEEETPSGSQSEMSENAAIQVQQSCSQLKDATKSAIDHMRFDVDPDNSFDAKLEREQLEKTIADMMAKLQAELTGRESA
jgi:hypothetical protein